MLIFIVLRIFFNIYGIVEKVMIVEEIVNEEKRRFWGLGYFFIKNIKDKYENL